MQISLEGQDLNMCHQSFQQIESPKCQKFNIINKFHSRISIRISTIRKIIKVVRLLLNIVTMRISWSVLNLLMILKRIIHKIITLRIQIERKPKFKSTLPQSLYLIEALQFNRILTRE